MNHDSFALSGVIAAHEEWDSFPREIDSDILFHYFALSPSDLFHIEQCRGAVNQLGFAVQLCCLRWRGHFLADTRNLPMAVLENLAQQLGISPMQIPDYPHNHKTRSEHLERIRQHLGFSKFDESERKRLVDYIRGQATTLPRAAALYQLACRWLYQKRVVRPGQMILRKITGAAKEAALQQAYERLAGGLTPQQQAQLDALLGPATQASKQPSDEPDESGSPTPRSRLERFKLLPRRESTGALYALILRLTDLQAIRLTTLPILHQIHPAMRALLASWGYRYDAWSLGRFSAAKRHAILLTFLQAALAETVDAIVEMQDKLITRLHNNARQRREEFLRTTEKARRRAVELLEALGSLVVDESIPDAELRARIFAHWSSIDIHAIVTECHSLRSGDDGSYLRFLASWYGYTRKYSPILLASTPFEFAPDSALGRAVEYMREVDGQGRQFTNDAPTGFLTPRWEKYVVSSDAGRTVIARPFYELALLSTLNERIKAGEVTVSGSRRWTNFEDYLIPADVWRRERLQHYARLGLPVDPDLYIARLSEQLTAVTTAVEARLPANSALTIDAARGQFTLSAREGRAASETVKKLKDLIGIHLPRIDLVDLLIDIDNETDFLRHFISQGSYERDLNPALHRRNVLAALIAVGCNIGPVRMASASPGIALSDITYIADWCFSEEALRAAISDLINYTLTL
ncbi:MAG: DUF4158 domain-containing protein, partial [Acidobacteriota bacterium]|nr:DUF4158 domain-containing protein [Acidobacteriota bacterium]